MKLEKKKIHQVRNFRRRKFLKYSLIAGGGFLAGKFLDSIQNLFSSKKSNLMGLELTGPQEEKTKIFKNFVVQETDKELNFYDKEGYKIFVIEK